MSTLIWKEWRENLKWALLAMLTLAGAEYYALHQTSYGSPEYYEYGSTGVTLCRQPFLIVSIFGPPAVGFILGLLQVLPELKRDRWAALLHRPVPWGTIFWGKAAAGLLLYLIGAGLPFLFCIWLAATPGHFAAPFVPGLMCPGLADLGTGFVFYCAALLVALQRSGGIVLRVLPVFAALHIAFFVTTTGDFTDALIAAALMAAALIAAAWGAIQNQWSIAPRPWLARFALFAVTFYGLCGLGDLTRFLLAREHFFNSTAYEFTDDGLPIKVRYREGVIASATDLDDKPLVGEKYRPDRIRNHLRYLNSCSGFIGDPHGLKDGWPTQRYRTSYNYIIPASPFQYPRLQQWFYLEDQRTVAGVLPNGKEMFARLDANGFQPSSAEATPFAPGLKFRFAGSIGAYLWDNHSLRYANLAQQKITNLELPSPGPIYGMASIWASGEDGSIHAAAVALPKAVAVYEDQNGKFLASLPYDRDMDRWGSLSVGFGANKDRFYLRYEPSIWIPYKVRRQLPSYLEVFDAQGQVLHTYTLPPLPGFRTPPSLTDTVARRIQSPAFFFGTLAYQKAGAALGSERLKAELESRMGDEWPKTKRTEIEISILSLLCAALTLWWARRTHFSWPQAWKWAGVAVVFNVAGLLAFRFMTDWPRLVPCPACRRSRPTDHGTCPSCGEGWPANQPNGTEIFDDADTPEDVAVAL